MKILITGGAGFIGSHLTEAFLKQGAHVKIIDDLSTGTIDNIAELQNDPQYKNKITLHTDTILNTSLVYDTVSECDLVLHLAAAVGVKHIMENPLSSIKTNIMGTENILNSCAKLGKKVLITSSSEVYGKHTHAPLLENDNILYGPAEKSRWSYAASKLMDEFMALAYFRTQGLNVIIIRPFNVVGPKQTGSYGMVVPKFIKQALKNDNLTVYGDGSQSRTFIYVKDAVKAIMLLLKNKTAPGEMFNIGSKEEITILNLAKKIVKISGSTSTIDLVPYENVFENNFEDILRRVPAINKLKEYTGFEPETQLDTTLKSTIHYHKTNFKS